MYIIRIVILQDQIYTHARTHTPTYMHILVHLGVFHNCWNKTMTIQNFPVDFILFLDYCWEIVYIFICISPNMAKHTLDIGTEDFLWEDISLTCIGFHPEGRV